MGIAFPKIYIACHLDENGIKPGSNLNTADKGVAEPSRAENVSRIHSLLGKIDIFLYTGKNNTSFRY